MRSKKWVNLQKQTIFKTEERVNKANDYSGEDYADSRSTLNEDVSKRKESHIENLAAPLPKEKPKTPTKPGLTVRPSLKKNKADAATVREKTARTR